MEVSSIRKEYKLKSLNEEEVLKNPLDQFANWFKEALDAQVLEVNAMTLSTSNKQGKPSARIVLLKDFSANGFVFFTNYESKKAEEIGANPFACLTFFWPELERQVRVEGSVQKISEIDSDDYFQSRPFESRVGAWVSAQSKVIPNRSQLEDRYKELLKDYQEQGRVPKPPYWGGYCLKPDYMEFWQGRPSRLHDRIAYQQVDGAWNICRLAP